MKLPKRQSDILAKTYLEYEKYISNISKDETELNILRNTIKIFYGIDDNVYNKLGYKNILELNSILTKLLSQTPKLKPIIKIKGVRYGLIPNFSDMSMGEYVDCDTDDVIKQMCILYRPIIKKRGNKYNIEKYKANIDNYETFKNEITLDILLGYVGFFLKISKDILSYSQKYLMGMDLTVGQMKILQNNGAGILGFTNSVMKI